LHLLGGRRFIRKQKCVIRSQTLMGSSTLWPDQFDYGGPISDDPEYNPDFYDWNHAFFVYCDGASFSGDKTDPVTVDGTTLYYRGHRILIEIINDLIKNKGLDSATDVLLAGDSAGAMATYYHVEEIRSLMPSSVTRFKAAPFSGVFLDRPNVKGEVYFRGTLGGVFNDQNCSGSVNTKCIEANPDDQWKCFFAEYLLEHIETPIFIVNSADDVVGIMCIALGEPLLGVAGGCGNCSAVPGWEECEDPDLSCSKCTQDQWSKIEEYAAGFRQIIENHPKMSQDGNGLYEYDCISHCTETDFSWDHLIVNDTLLRDAVRDWFFSDNEPASKHTYKDCPISVNGTVCNPTCDEPSSSSSSRFISGSGSSVYGSSASGSSFPDSSASGSSSDNASIINPMMPVICAAFIAIYHLLF